jgi:PAS domain S-box-containing protein
MQKMHKMHDLSKAQKELHELPVASDESHFSYGLLQHLVQHHKNAIMAVDPVNLVLLKVDDNTCSMLGYQREELIGHPLSTVESSLYDVFFWEELKQDTYFKGVRTGETEWLTKNGESIPIARRVTSYVEAGQHMWVLQIEDITLLRDSTEEQIYLLSQLQSSIEATAEGILVVDLQGKVINLNGRFSHIWQLPDEVLAERSAALIFEQIKGLLLEEFTFSQMQVRLIEETECETEDLLALRDGRFVVCVSKPYFQRDRLVGRVFSLRDITPMKQVEQQLVAARDAAELASQEKSRMLDALRVSESRLRRLVNSSLIGIMQGDKEGKITEANDVLLQIVGISREEFTQNRGLHWEQFTSDAFHAIHQKGLDDLQRHEQTVPYEIEIIDQQGAQIPAMVGLARLEGAETEWVGFVLDLTEQRKADRVKSDFISMVSHELRTPLTSIRGALGLLESGVGGNLSPKIMNLVKIAHKNSQRLGALVNDLLDMEKLASGKMILNIERFDLVALTKQSLEANAAYAQTLSVKYRLNNHPDQAWVMGDSSRVMQVLTNLLSNGAKFAPAGDFVDVQILPDEGTFRVEVRDRGVGIPMNFRDRIFKKFAQANDGNTRQQGGTGLGLNISRTFVEKMGGDIGFESEEGVGTMFWFTLVAGVHRRADPER